MRQSRKRLLSAAFALFIGAHLFVLCTGSQHWPIVSYPMFSERYERSFHCLVPYAEYADAGRPEARLWQNIGFFFFSLKTSLEKMRAYPWRAGYYERYARACSGGDEAAIHACVARSLVADALGGIYRHYEDSRRQAPDLPPLAGVRLYDVHYEMAPDGTTSVVRKDLIQDWSPELPR